MSDTTKIQKIQRNVANLLGLTSQDLSENACKKIEFLSEYFELPNHIIKIDHDFKNITLFIEDPEFDKKYLTEGTEGFSQFCIALKEAGFDSYKFRIGMQTVPDYESPHYHLLPTKRERSYEDEITFKTN